MPKPLEDELSTVISSELPPTELVQVSPIRNSGVLMTTEEKAHGLVSDIRIFPASFVSVTVVPAGAAIP